MSWAELADEFEDFSQKTAELEEEAAALQSDSDVEDYPAMWWVRSLKACAAPIKGNLQPQRPIRILSGCSGTLAEAAVLQVH